MGGVIRPSGLWGLILSACIWLMAGGLATAATDGAACRVVRMSDIGWTDVTATTALTSVLLENLGYQPKITVLSVPVTFAAMKNKDVDLFLGNWMPAMAQDREPFLKDGSVEVIRQNLDGAKYTLAVPAYTYEAGLHDFSDIHRFADALNHTIYGIEPGNDGNRQVLGIIRRNANNLGDFKLVESSEQGMLAEVERAIRNHQHIVFLGWEPHPMNTRMALRYLSGGDDTFGPNFGGAKIYTNARAGYVRQCPNVGRLLQNLSFNLKDEDELMAQILEKHVPARAAAQAGWRASPPLMAARPPIGRPGRASVRPGRTPGSPDTRFPSVRPCPVSWMW
jgi:glycine betaine/proline transport system substrate-binding protein